MKAFGYNYFKAVFSFRIIVPAFLLVFISACGDFSLGPITTQDIEDIEHSYYRPTLLTPANESTNVSRNPVFQWTGREIGVRSYRINVTDCASHQTVLDEFCDSTTYIMTCTLKGNSLYQWYVVEKSGFGSGYSSVTFWFLTGH